MHFTFLSLLATFLVVAGAASAITPFAKICGDNAAVVSNKTVVLSSGKELFITQTSCPNAVSHKRSYPVKRQTNVCSATGTFYCENFPNDPVPTLSDCLQVGLELENTAGTFIAESGQVYSFVYGTCESSFLNFDSVDYEYCYQAWGANTIETAAECLPANNVGNWLPTSYPSLGIQILNGY